MRINLNDFGYLFLRALSYNDSKFKTALNNSKIEDAEELRQEINQVKQSIERKIDFVLSLLLDNSSSQSKVKYQGIDL